MENQQWPAKYQQSGAGTDTADSLDNGEKSDGKEEADRKEADSPTISEKAMQLISVILDQMKEMTNAEKYLLYLKLFQKSNVVDPLRQPLNPLGSRSEINRTISWIKTHLEEDPDTSLPKQQVYEEYSRYCFQNQIKSLSQADFGKVMKQVYPKVRARRLGTRGNSRYCYSGLRRCIKLKAPKLPDLADKPLSTEAPCTQSSLTAAAWLIVKEWSELHFGVQFPSLQALARFLVLNHSVGVGSDAANQLTSATEAQLKGENGKGGTKHREMQLQLQKKIQQKNEVKERKRKIQSPKCDPKPCKKSKSSRPETSPTLTVAGESSTSTSTGSTSTSPTQGKPICDKSLDFTQLPSLPDFKSFQKPVCEQQQQQQNGGGVAAKVAIPRLAMKAQQQRSPQSSPKKQAKNAKYKAIQPKPQPCDNASYNPQQPSTAAADIRSQGVNVDRFKERIKCSDDDCDAPVFPLSRERLESISNVDKDAMDEYLGTNNSQHEEELSKYFNDNIETADQDNTTKLSQLRQLLEQNGISDSKNFPPPPLIAAAPDVSLAAPALLDPLVPAMAPFVAAAPAPQTAAPHGRRRVSFETPLQDGGDAVPPSPNTRRKNFSFTPISPGPQSPNGGRQSSTNVSPFVSPRNTPVPRSKNTAHQNAGLGVARKKIKREQPELSVDIPKNYMAMSAPASPMLYSSGGGGGSSKSMLEKLLHSNSKVPYTPDYASAAPAKQDLSGEIGGLLENNDLADFTVGYHRSQSVPLKASFDFQPAGDFGDFDPIPDAAEAVTVNRIIDSLEEQTYEAMAGFGLIEGFAAMPCRRSQSIDCYEPAAAVEKVNPSRSVPSTPLPVRGQPGSRSYPSTPLLEAAFEYAAVNGDCLLNGQPIRAAASNGLAFFMEDLNEMGEPPAAAAAEDEFGRSLAGNEFAAIVENENGLMDENGVLIGEQSFAGN